MQRYLIIAIGGALGAITRYEIGRLAAERFGMRFPVGTLFINVSACFLISFSVEFLNRHANINEAWRYLIPVGFIGAIPPSPPLSGRRGPISLQELFGLAFFTWLSVS